ncbi:hypothetical protein V6N13_030638 [Hibiscus sabdariffa]
MKNPRENPSPSTSVNPYDPTSGRPPDPTLQQSSRPVCERAAQSVSREDVRVLKKSRSEEQVSTIIPEHEPMVLEDGMISHVEQSVSLSPLVEVDKHVNPLAKKASYASKVVNGHRGRFGSGVEMDPKGEDIKLLPEDIIIDKTDGCCANVVPMGDDSHGAAGSCSTEFRPAKDAKGADLYGPWMIVDNRKRYPSPRSRNVLPKDVSMECLSGSRFVVLDDAERDMSDAPHCEPENGIPEHGVSVRADRGKGIMDTSVVPGRTPIVHLNVAFLESNPSRKTRGAKARLEELGDAPIVMVQGESYYAQDIGAFGQPPGFDPTSAEMVDVVVQDGSTTELIQ